MKKLDNDSIAPKLIDRVAGEMLDFLRGTSNEIDFLVEYLYPHTAELKWETAAEADLSHEEFVRCQDELLAVAGPKLRASIVSILSELASTRRDSNHARRI